MEINSVVVRRRAFVIMRSERKANYSLGEIIKNGASLIYTIIFWKNARLIRIPVYVRGKKGIAYQKGFTVGYRCRLECNGDINGKKLKIGENCVFGDNVQIEANKSVTIGDNVLIASRVFISDTTHGKYYGISQDNPYTPPNERKLHFRDVSIGNNVWIGENVSILSGVNIGDGCIISANSVVTKNISSGCIAGGVPAIVIKKYNKDMNQWEKTDDSN